jgi:hypothetical protein
MGQAVLRVEGLPQGTLDAAAAFHREWLPKIRAFLDPPRGGEGDHPQDGGGGLPPARSLEDESPLRQPDGLPPPRPGEDLVLIFPAASYDHRGWRLAAVQDLAREAAPRRVNALVGDQEGARAAAVEWLAQAPGITGQLLAVD